MCPLHAPYVPPMCPDTPPTCPLHVPYAPLRAPYTPPTRPLHALRAPMCSLCTPYTPLRATKPSYAPPTPPRINSDEALKV